MPSLMGKDAWHTKVSQATEIAEREPLILPLPAVTEITYLLNRSLGLSAVVEFVESLANTRLIIESPVPEDFLRSAAILRKYDDANIDFVDACIVAMAERLKITKILTVDRRHFSIFKPLHCDSFEILP